MGFLRSFRPDKKSRLPKVMFSGFVSDFMLYAQSSFAGQTNLMYRSCLGQFLKYVGDIPLQSLTAKHLDVKGHFIPQFEVQSIPHPLVG